MRREGNLRSLLNGLFRVAIAALYETINSAVPGLTFQARTTSPSVPIVSHLPIRQFFANVEHTFKLHAHCDFLSKFAYSSRGWTYLRFAGSNHNSSIRAYFDL